MPWLDEEGKRKKFSLCRKRFFICMERPFFLMLFSRPIIALLSAFLAAQGYAQIKDRDYTRQLGSQFKRYQSSSSLFGGKVNSRISAKRIHVSEIPFHFSRFGGKRYPANNVEIKQRLPIPTSTLKTSMLHGGARVGSNDRFAFRDASKMNSTSAVAQEFRQKHDASLDKRIDDWMAKVNNLSLADVNRQQFRRGRSTTPGFPVQKAGESGVPQPQSLLPSALQGTGSGSSPKAPSRYWLGPLKTKKTTPGNRSMKSRPTPQSQSSSKTPLPDLSPKYLAPRTTGQPRYPQIRLGPPKISVQTK